MVTDTNSFGCIVWLARESMQNMGAKWWVVLVVFLSLAPAIFAVQDRSPLRRGGPKPIGDPIPRREALGVPEGGCSLVYVLGAGVTCVGAILLRSQSNLK